MNLNENVDFDKLIDRRLYPTQKWNSADLKQHFGRDDLLPLSLITRGLACGNFSRALCKTISTSAAVMAGRISQCTMKRLYPSKIVQR